MSCRLRDQSPSTFPTTKPITPQLRLAVRHPLGADLPLAPPAPLQGTLLIRVRSAYAFSARAALRRASYNSAIGRFHGKLGVISNLDQSAKWSGQAGALHEDFMFPCREDMSCSAAAEMTYRLWYYIITANRAGVSETAVHV